MRFGDTLANAIHVFAKSDFRLVVVVVVVLESKSLFCFTFFLQRNSEM